MPAVNSLGFEGSFILLSCEPIVDRLVTVGVLSRFFSFESEMSTETLVGALLEEGFFC